MTALEAFEMCLKLEQARRDIANGSPMPAQTREAVVFCSDILRRDLRTMLTPTMDALEEAAGKDGR